MSKSPNDLVILEYVRRDNIFVITERPNVNRLYVTIANGLHYPQITICHHSYRVKLPTTTNGL